MNQNPYQSPQTNISSQSQYIIEPNNSTWYSFSGRIGRLRYLSYPLFFTFIFYLIIGIAGAAAGATGSEAAAMTVIVIAFVGGIPLCIYGLFIYPIRRLHDLGQSGWLALLLLVPLVGFGFFLFLVFAPGSADDNEFGDSPRPNKWYHWVGALVLPVIFVVGILAAIAIPAYQQYIERAHAAQMQSE